MGLANVGRRFLWVSLSLFVVIGLGVTLSRGWAYPIESYHPPSDVTTVWQGCVVCHGPALDGLSQAGDPLPGPSCQACHNDFGPGTMPPVGHHGTTENRQDPWTKCVACHGDDLLGGSIAPVSCFTCHDAVWNDLELPPVADAGGPYVGFVGISISFDGSGSSDPELGPLTYLWDFGDGSTSVDENPTHTYVAAGSYDVTLTVTDNADLTDTATTTAEVSVPTNLPPVADAGGPYAGIVGHGVVLDASASFDPDGDALTYKWDFGDGHSQAAPSNSPTATHVYEAVGIYTAKVAVDDGVNPPVTSEVVVEIEDGPPPPEGDVWAMQIPISGEQFTIELEEFAGVLLVRTSSVDGPSSIGIGMEFDGVIVWMDPSGNIFFGNINRTAGTMSGILFGDEVVGGIWFAERL